MVEALIESKNSIPPFLRWTGSKRWFTKDHIDKFLPSNFNNYHEPFLGGGAVFFHIKNIESEIKRSYYLSDTNEELINCYQQLKLSPENTISYLKKFENTEENYYKIRAMKLRSPARKAARFIYLNRTSFNGIYRVNPDGKYNVPYGHRPNADIVTENLLLSVSNLLRDTIISNFCFEECIQYIHKNDLVFIDPPYTVAHENNGFIEYNQKLFSWNDQLKLKEFVKQLIKIGAFFILTNASHTSIMELYKGMGKIVKLSRDSKVGGRIKTRGKYNELIISNTI